MAGGCGTSNALQLAAGLVDPRLHGLPDTHLVAAHVLVRTALQADLVVAGQVRDVLGHDVTQEGHGRVLQPAKGNSKTGVQIIRRKRTEAGIRTRLALLREQRAGRSKHIPAQERGVGQRGATGARLHLLAIMNPPTAERAMMNCTKRFFSGV